MTTYDSINAERRKHRQREFTLSEYEAHRGRYARMAAPGTDLNSFLLGIMLANSAPDYSGRQPTDDAPSPSPAYSGVDSSSSPSFDGGGSSCDAGGGGGGGCD